MKKVLLIVSFLGASVSVIACDICGSGTGGSYLGILPSFRKRFFGLRYQQNSLLSHLGMGGNRTYLSNRETFRVVECWGAFNIGKKFRVAAFIPYNFIERTEQQHTMSRKGVGDITAIGFYQLFNKQQEVGKNLPLVQSLWIGAGVKLPVGDYNPADKNIQESAQNTFQLGTGSFDFSAHLTYDIRLENAGINTNISYKLNTNNKYAYHYGNKLTLNMLGYYKIEAGEKFVLAPNSGIMYEQASKDRKTMNIQVWETGGNSMMGTIGLEIAFGKISTGGNFQTPLSQNLAEGKVRAGTRGMVHVSMAF